MDIKEIIKSQYRAALAILGEAVDKCPDALWAEEGVKQQFWHIAYHVLFFTHLYLQVDGGDFVPWAKHREPYQFFESLPWDPGKPVEIGEPYTKTEILEYLAICQAEVEEKVDAAELDGESGFSWLPMCKLELQFYNIRHLQHHVGQLDDRLRINANIGIRWIGAKPAGNA